MGLWGSLLGIFLVFGNPLEGARLWVDTDLAAGEAFKDVDDAMALLYLFQNPDIQIAGISTVFGNSSAKSSERRAKWLAQKFSDQMILVYTGYEKRSKRDQPSSASLALEAALETEELRILLLGPATNLADVIRRRPDLIHRIKDVTAVAGKRKNQVIRLGWVPLDDMNVVWDSEAFETLVASHVTLNLTPWEVSTYAPIDHGDLDSLKRGDAEGRWFQDKARAWLVFWNLTMLKGGFLPFDAMASAYIDTPERFSCDVMNATIESGRVIVRESENPDRPVHYCHTVQKNFKDHLLDRLAGR